MAGGGSPEEGGDGGNKVNILIVDDQNENLLALEAILQDLGQPIVKARSGDEALRHLYFEEYAVVLLDVRMPGMDGYEVASYIRSRPKSRHTPIIFVTAFDDSMERVSKAYSIGAVDYIQKPINGDVLRSKVKVFVELSLKSKSLEREIAERKRVEEELRASNKELEAFSYSVSHDLRAPLRALAGFSEALLEDYGDRLDEAGRTFAERIVGGAKQMDALILDLLYFSRLAREKVTLEPLDPQVAIRDALSLLHADDSEVRVEGALPPVVGSKVLVTQVFQNLLSNALKFVPKGERPIVTVRSEKDGERVRFWVEDKGIGIAPEHQERIFRVFEQLNHSKLYPGTGIGLAIVRRAMERMGGKVGLESAVGAGSKFWIELPPAEAARKSGEPQMRPRADSARNS